MSEIAPESDKDKPRRTLSIGAKGSKTTHVRQTLAGRQSRSVQVESKRRRILTTDPADVAKPQEALQENIAADKLPPAEQQKRSAALEKARKAEQKAAKDAKRAKKETSARKKPPEVKPDKPSLSVFDAESTSANTVTKPTARTPATKVNKSRPVGKAGGNEDREEQERRTSRPPAGRTDRRRREGKLTIHDALNDEERARSLASIRRHRERANRQTHIGESAEKVARTVIVPETITIQELANRMAERAATVIKILMQQGVMAQINDTIDADTAQLITEELGHIAKRVSDADIEESIDRDSDSESAKTTRPPVITVMGHVDHGKTSLLDAFRKASVAKGEAGGITQHIGAYQVETKNGGLVTFIDTPGHAAFTAMRARGARVTDIVILVVASDDGVKPQTIEAIDHARAAKVPLIVAINKIDLPNADSKRIKTELLQHGVIADSDGGDVQMVEVSAKTGGGLDTLLDAIFLQSELMELKANATRTAEGTIIEAKLDKGRGAIATILIQRGTLRQGDVFVVGQESGRVRALLNEQGVLLKQATPSMPCEILGLSGVPQAGDLFNVVESEIQAREIADYRSRKIRDDNLVSGARGSVDQMLKKLEDNEQKELAIIVKADVHGSVEAVTQAIETLGNDQVRARVVLGGVGAITESDVTLAKASQAMIVGFNVRANAQARESAAQSKIDWHYYTIIYELIDAVQGVMSGMLPPKIEENILGRAEVREIFALSKGGNAAGGAVRDGIIRRKQNVRIIRDEAIVYTGALSSLRRFKDEVREVNAGQDCGMAFENFADVKPGDMIECFEIKETASVLKND